MQWYLQHNSFQAALVTDGHHSYCLFIYHCGLLTTLQAAIGYTATGNFFFSHPKSQSPQSNEVDCGNSPGSKWNTLLYPIHYDGKRGRERERERERFLTGVKKLKLKSFRRHFVHICVGHWETHIRTLKMLSYLEVHEIVAQNNNNFHKDRERIRLQQWTSGDLYSTWCGKNRTGKYIIH